MNRVILFRRERPNDRFAAGLNAAGFSVTCIEVLRFEYVNVETLKTCLENPEEYGGMVLTSPRVMEAIRWARIDLTQWKSRPAYVVGPTTAAIVRESGLNAEGELSGTADRLADYIIDRHTAGRLLLMAGNRSLDVLPERLQKAKMPYTKIVVYNTHVHDVAMKDVEEGSWFVFFSPSGVDAVLGTDPQALRGCRVAAIGPRTADALVSLGIQPDAVAEQPTPGSLIRSIISEVRT